MSVNIVNIRCMIPIFCFLCAIYGLWHYLKGVEKNDCDMTYMFEYPEYLKVPMNYNVSAKFPRYKLFVYGEGKYADELSDHKYRGNPVLFIPGNAGSHRQVRSLASVSLRISQSRLTPLHFNYFTIDFNEEISGLYGGTLEDQTEFVHQCIFHIQTLYPKKKKIILIGHSMGGVIAKAVFAFPSFQSSDVSLIFTLASPHQQPVIALDSALVEFYAKIKEAWRYRLNNKLKNIPIISIGGGQRDTLVRSDLIWNNFMHTSPLDVHVLTTAIPGVWLSTDHLAIVWCKQLVLTVCRSLFDLSYQKSDQAALGSSAIEDVLNFHYYKRAAGNRWPVHLSHFAHTFPSSGEWIQQGVGVWRFSKAKVLSSIYILVPLSPNGNILIIASGLVKGDWIFGCTKFSTAENKTCSEGENLSEEAEIIPSRKPGVERRMIHFKNEKLLNKSYLSLLIFIAPVDSKVEMLGETYIEGERMKQLKLPSLVERILSVMPHRLFTISLVDQIVYYNVTVPKSSGVFEAVEFQLETRLCRAGSVVGQGIVKLHIPWSKEDTFYPVKTSMGGLTTIPVLSHSLPKTEDSQDVNLLFLLDPECSVVLTAKFSFSLMLSQFMKFYGTYIVGYVVAFFFILLAEQLHTFGTSGTASLSNMFSHFPTFITLVILPTFIFHFIWITGFTLPFLPHPDVLDPSSSVFRLLLLRSLLYLISCGLVILVCFVLEAMLRGISTAWIYVKRQSILQTTQVPLEQISRNRVELAKGTLVFSAILAALCIGVSSSLATTITFIFYFLKLSSMHLRCKLEEERRGSNLATIKWYFHFVLVLLWMSAMLLTAPGLVMWAKNLKFSLKLSPDVYVLHCTILILLTALLWQLTTPVITRYKYKAAAFFIQVFAFLTCLYGISSIYRERTLVAGLAHLALGWFRANDGTATSKPRALARPEPRIQAVNPTDDPLPQRQQPPKHRSQECARI